MESLIKDQCGVFLEKVEKDFYHKTKQLQRDIINATSKKYGFQVSNAYKDYGLAEEEEVLEEDTYGEVEQELSAPVNKVKPKKCKTARAFFIEANRAAVKKEFPEEVTNRLGEMWKKIKDGPEAKPYKDLNKKDKLRYDAEQLSYMS